MSEQKRPSTEARLVVAALRPFSRGSSHLSLPTPCALGAPPPSSILDQRGTGVIPKSQNPSRMAENLSIFDFRLDENDMRLISELNCNRRYNDPGVFCEAAFNTFYPIYD